MPNYSVYYIPKFPHEFSYYTDGSFIKPKQDINSN
jgi:hypothetical protein